jgi:hypothetical protein
MKNTFKSTEEVYGVAGSVLANMSHKDALMTKLIFITRKIKEEANEFFGSGDWYTKRDLDFSAFDHQLAKDKKARELVVLELEELGLTINGDEHDLPKEIAGVK